ncbi:MAG: hypothetical protein R2880_14955 [Deinococcales bacterium]
MLTNTKSMVLNNLALQEALGSNYAEFGESLSDAKSNDGTVSSFVFFSYSRNQSVIAYFMSDGG